MTLAEQLKRLREVLVLMTRELERHAPGLAGYWHHRIRDLEGLVSGGAELQELAYFAEATDKSIGIGMGSLRDTFVSHAFEPLLEEASALLGDIASRWDRAPENPNHLRRHLFELEEQFLAASMDADAATIREIIRSDLDVPNAARVVESLAVRHDLTQRMKSLVSAARASLEAVTRANTDA